MRQENMMADYSDWVWDDSDGQQEDGDYRLPADGTQASWLRGDRSESGRFTIEGDKVGLCVRSDGTLLKPVKR